MSVARLNELLAIALGVSVTTKLPTLHIGELTQASTRLYMYGHVTCLTLSCPCVFLKIVAAHTHPHVFLKCDHALVCFLSFVIVMPLPFMQRRHA